MLIIGGSITSKEHAEAIAQAEAAMKGSKYVEAVAFYEKARPLDKKDIVNYEKCKGMIQSVESYERGINALANSDYIEAVECLGSVLPEDEERYSYALPKLNEAKTVLAEIRLKEAKTLYGEGQYQRAYNMLLDSINTTDDVYQPAADLLDTYEKKKIEQAEKEAAERKQKLLTKAKDQMKMYERGSGIIGIAVEVKTSQRVDTSYNYYTAGKNCQFVWVGISVKNYGSGNSHVNPNYITLSTPDGYTVNPHTEATYSRNNYFDAVDLPPGGSSSGWLIFHIPISDEYTLNYNSIDSSVTKRVIP